MKTLEPIIAQHPFVIGMDPKHTAIMADGAKEVEFDPDDILFREGEPANRLFLILSGRVVLESQTGRNKTVTIQDLQGGDVLGWSWLFPPFAWHFRARALTPMRAIVCDGGHLLVTCEENHDFGYELMRRVSQVAIRRMQAARKTLLAGGLGGLGVEKKNGGNGNGARRPAPMH